MSGLIDPRKMITWAAGMLLPSIALATQPMELIVTDEPSPSLADYENAPVPTTEEVAISDVDGPWPTTVAPPSAGSPSLDAHGEPLRRGILNRILLPADHRFTATVDALMLWQVNLASRPLFAATATGQTVLDANQLLPEMAAGPRYGLFVHLDDCYAFEGNYFNVTPFAAEQTLPAGSGRYEELNLAGLIFRDITAATVTSTGQIQSAEFNWRRRQGPLTWLGGFRWVEWNESLGFDNQSPAGMEMLDGNTGNDLYGGQIGCDAMIWNAVRRVQVSTIGKAGIFYNQARQQTDVASPGTPPLSVSVTDQAEQTSFFGEVGGTMNVQLTKWLDWRLGYSVFWLSAVATPAQQLSLVNAEANPPTTGINTNGSVLLHGATTGLEARW